MDWVPLKSISDMMFINYKGFGKSKRGLVLWQNACITLIWVVWWERNARIFEDKASNSENLWDSIHFLAPFWAFCSAGFKGISLNVLQLDWLAVCSSNGMVSCIVIFSCCLVLLLAGGFLILLLYFLFYQYIHAWFPI